MKKYLPYILIIVFVLVGLFGSATKAKADDPVGTCVLSFGSPTSLVTSFACHAQAGNSGAAFVSWTPTGSGNGGATGTCSIPAPGGVGPPSQQQLTLEACTALGGTWTANSSGTTTIVCQPASGAPAYVVYAPASCTQGDFEISRTTTPAGQTGQQGDPHLCGVNWPIIGNGGSLEGCLNWFAQKVMHVVNFIIWGVGQIMNFVVQLALGGGTSTGGSVYSNPFILKTWAVMRDLANLFFIFILLYTAIKIILDLDAGGAKKTIAQIIIMAMLINFSMFFTFVVIDSSNILALIFYNKIGAEVTTNGTPYTPVNGERDLSGGAMALTGDKLPGDLAGPDVINSAKNVAPAGAAIGSAAANVLFEVMMGLALQMWGVLLLIVGIIVFIIIILAFLNRIVTLMILIIFSPFAFMSTTLPLLRKMDYLGWDDWVNRLFKSAFFAPIFMFFLYVIFLVTKGLLAMINTPLQGGGFVQTIIGLTFGFGFVMTLLYMAIHFAYKASGKAGEIVMGAVKVAAIAGLAAVTAGAGLAATGAIGGAASKVLNNPALQKAASEGDAGAKRKIWWANKANKFDTTAAIHGITGGKLKSSLFDRVSGATGLEERISTKGGHKGVVERTAQRRREEGELYKTTETNDEVRRRTTEEQNGYDDKKKEATKTIDAEYESKHGTRPETVQEKYDREKAEVRKKATFNSTPEAEAAWNEQYKKNVGARPLEDIDETERIRDEQEKYDKEKSTATKSFNEDYEERNGPRPDTFETADAYNNDILKKFQKSLGTRDTLGMVAQARLKADDKIIDKTNFVNDPDYQDEYNRKHGKDATAADSLDTDISEKLNHERIMKERVAIGGTQARGEFKYSRELDKQFTQMKQITDRMDANTEALTKINESFEGTEGPIASGWVSGDRQKGFITTEAFTKEMSKLQSTAEVEQANVARLVAQGGVDANGVQSIELKGAIKRSEDAKTEIAKLNKIKAGTEEEKRLRTDNYKLGRDKNQLTEKQAGGGTAAKEKQGPATTRPTSPLPPPPPPPKP